MYDNNDGRPRGEPLPHLLDLAFQVMVEERLGKVPDFVRYPIGGMISVLVVSSEFSPGRPFLIGYASWSVLPILVAAREAELRRSVPSCQVFRIKSWSDGMGSLVIGFCRRNTCTSSSCANAVKGTAKIRPGGQR